MSRGGLMLVASDRRSLPPAQRAVAIGKFDGVHRGHQSVLRTLRETGLRTTVITFDPHPGSVLGRPVEPICSLEERLELLEQAGVDETLVIEFTRAYASLSPLEWIDRTLVPIGARTICVGSDFRFGHRRAGDLTLLEACGFDVRIAERVEGASSTAIRQLLRDGRTREAEQLLRPRVCAAA
ncbi:MAG: adenylyltransferase/cytidyltransferase family protein [Solirubrobacteraceae bacterium]